MFDSAPFLHSEAALALFSRYSFALAPDSLHQPPMVYYMCALD